MSAGLDGGILVATDGSEGAARAEALAMALAAGCQARLVILTGSRGLPADELRRLAHSEGDLGEARHALIASILEGAVQRAQAAGVPEIKPVSQHGDPATAIIDTAKSEGVRLIVLGRRGVGAISRLLLLGSVSKYVVDHAPCAVTVVP